MPVNSRPFASLKVLIVVAWQSMICCIPTGTPNLQELVVFSTGAAEVSFDNPTAAFAELKTLYVFGWPLVVGLSESSKSQVMENMVRRGLLLSTVKADEAEA